MSYKYVHQYCHAYHDRVRSTKDPLPQEVRLPGGKVLNLNVRVDPSAQRHIEGAYNCIRARVRSNERAALRVNVIRAIHQGKELKRRMGRPCWYRTEPKEPSTALRLAVGRKYRYLSPRT